ncbi:uncharacterized protein LOC118735872 [Rhagoletis pomonella]|uniref:uncharacterized protein LOC118735872 n=1 Tax=Rhagoletis pomonella TaxID=28610 RepID=UPI0017847BBA|nr:uncharacterized protein LOC118735872 [Rhagoletis pomonella]
MNNNKQTIRIVGLPRSLSIRKLSILLNRHKQAWKLEDLIPLETCLVAIVCCETEETYDSFIKLSSIPPFSLFPGLRVYNLPPATHYTQQLELNLTSTASLLYLNTDCLRIVFEQCSLKCQLALAKVCHYFHKVIVDIWRQRYATLLFSLYHFKVVHELNDNELWDFCLLVGPHVHRLIFNSVLFFPVIQRFIADQPGNMMQNAKRYMNIILCRHLVHFAPLQSFEVQGKFLAEYTVRELARYCPQLRALQLLDAGTRWLLGKHFHLLRRVELLNLHDCENLRRRLMRKTCHALQLKSLNLVECKELLHPPTIWQLCMHFQMLQQLHLTALADTPLLAAILELPKLKELKFYWLNDFVEFVKSLFTELSLRRRESLCTLHCANESIFLENASQRVWRAGEYAAMRELATINGRPWQWQECFDEWLKLLGDCTSLESLTYEYCRVFSYEQILALPKMGSHLKLIRLIGCRDECDEKLIRSWMQQQNQGCRLCIEGELPWGTVQRLRDRVMPFRRENNHQPIYRSIECHFK